MFRAGKALILQTNAPMDTDLRLSSRFMELSQKAMVVLHMMDDDHDDDDDDDDDDAICSMPIL